MTSVLETVWDLWVETGRECESLGDPLLLECLEAASNGRIFDDLADTKLKPTLSLINSLLNDPKTRAKGLTLINDFYNQVNPSRLVGYQDAIISALHLVVKGLDSPLGSSVLASILPKCHGMSEVNQIVTTSIIPKALASFCDAKGGVQKEVEELQMLKVCLLEYHGPCGPVREKLEKILVHLIDSENSEVMGLLSEVIPLLSYAGGGGNAGERHSTDWNLMLGKFLRTAYSTLNELYGNSYAAFESENPFEGEFLTLKKISETRVLFRMSLLKRRLINLITIISGYLRSPFPAPKLVPQKGIVRLVEVLLSVNPVIPEKPNLMSVPKETAFLSAIVPGIHEASLLLLRSLFYCVGTNILIEGMSIEQLLVSEFKWMKERPSAYEKLKLELYESLTTWLTITGGIVTTTKSLTAWINAIGQDTRVEKDVIELKLLSKPKVGKSVKNKRSLSVNPASITTTSSQTFVKKNSDVCALALKALTYLIPSLDVDNHRKLYEHLIKTASVISQFQVPPSPYDNPQCRLLVYETLAGLAYHPQPKSPIALALLMTLLRQGMQDPVKLVSSSCIIQLSLLERLAHPASAPLILAGQAPIPIALDNSQASFKLPVENEIESSEEEETMDVEETSAAANSNENSTLPINMDDLESIIKKSILDALKNQPIPSPSVVQPPKPKLVRSDRVASSFASIDIDKSSQDKGPEKEVITLDADSTEEKTDDLSIVFEKPKTNGHSDHPPSSEEDESEDDLEEENEESEESGDEAISGKRKSNSDEEKNQAEDLIESQVKKLKTASPAKSPDQVDSSLQEMLASFIDDPVDGLL